MSRGAILPALVMVLMLAACAGGPGGAALEGAAPRPVLDRPPADERAERAKVHVDLGTAYFEVGRFDVALDEARTALRHHPQYAPAFHLRGLVYMYIDDVPAARENFLRALREAPRDPDFNNSYGWFQCLNEQPRDGLERLVGAARNPYYRHSGRALTNAGLCHRRLGEAAPARAMFERALALDAGNRVALFNLAEIAFEAGDLDEARRHLVSYHQRFDPTPESLWLGLRAERELGNKVSEASYAAQLRGRFADSPQYRELMQGDFE